MFTSLKRFTKIVCAGLLIPIICSCQNTKSASDIAVYLDDSKSIDERVEDALSRMTLEEKIGIIHAQSKFSSPGVPRLGIPELWMTDGPHGIRPEVLWDEWNQANWTNDSCTAFPALTCLAATWNEDMASMYGKNLGEEARYRKKDVVLGPGVNIYRTPLNGRNFEYMGEDPFLSGTMVAPYIQGLQSNGVAACVKHFALNNQEDNRHGINVTVDDRALYEIYLPAFKAAVVDGGALSIMGSYNKYKGEHCCHNQYLLNDILRGEWGFKGVVISDWGGTHNTKQAALNGLDLEFGTWTDGLSWGASNTYNNYYLASPYLEMIQKGELGTEELDQKVRRVLRLTFMTAMNRERPWGSIASPEHAAAARTIADEGIVLLKNEGNVLPVDFSKGKTIAVIGENAIKMMTVGGGSSSLKVKREISPLSGIEARAGKDVKVVYERGYVGDVTGASDGVVTGQDLNDKRSESKLLKDALALASSADYVIFFGGLNKSGNQDCEGTDRTQYGLPYAQDKVITELAKVNKNLVVVLISGNAVAMPWVDEVPAILQGWFIGSEAGNALADVISGDVNPSGKLPFSFPVKLEDSPAHCVGDYPGVDNEMTYKEGIFVGYRWFDTKNIATLWSFGHGLSYTTFGYGEAVADKNTLQEDGTVTVSVKVTNTGKCEGKEVVQLYIGDKESSLPRPVKELKGFRKVSLQPGEEKTVSFKIDKSALSFFDPVKHEWVAEPGAFEALIGSSSTDIRTKVEFTLL